MIAAEEWWQGEMEQRASPLRQAGTTRVGIGYALVDDCSSEDVCRSIVDHARRRGAPAYVITPNAQHIVLLEKDDRFRRVYEGADLVVADGVSLLMAARFYGQTLRERVAGVDMFQQLCRLAARDGLRVCLLGGRPGSAELAREALERQFPGLLCATYCPPQGFEHSVSALADVDEAVRAAKPDLLFVALGAPKQEYWIAERGLKLAVPVCIGVGGSFEMVAGVVKRAPGWLQDAGCEWLYRFYQEPRRMWRRYLIGNAQFAAIVLRQRMRRALVEAVMKLAAHRRFAAEMREVMLRNPEKATSLIMMLPYRDRAHIP